MVQRKKFDLILRDSWLIDIGERSHPNPMHRSSLFQGDFQTGNRFGWSFFFAVWRRCARSQLHMNSVVLVESQGSCALVRIVRLQKFDRRYNMIFTVHLNRLIDENTPLEQSTIETCLQEAYKYQKVTKIFLWHRVKVRSIVTGLRHDGSERDDDRSHRRVSIMSSLDAGWFRLIMNILIQSRDLAMIARWHQCGTMTSQMLARASFPPSVWPSSPFEFRPRTFTIGFYGKNSIISELMILECSFPLREYTKRDEYESDRRHSWSTRDE